jgi:hypothetical protein
VDRGAAAFIPRKKGEGAGEIYFFQLLHLSQGQSQARRWRRQLPIPSLANHLSLPRQGRS